MCVGGGHGSRCSYLPVTRHLGLSFHRSHGQGLAPTETPEQCSGKQHQGTTSVLSTSNAFIFPCLQLLAQSIGQISTTGGHVFGCPPLLKNATHKHGTVGAPPFYYVTRGKGRAGSESGIISLKLVVTNQPAYARRWLLTYRPGSESGMISLLSYVCLPAVSA